MVEVGDIVQLKEECINKYENGDYLNITMLIVVNNYFEYSIIVKGLKCCKYFSKIIDKNDVNIIFKKDSEEARKVLYDMEQEINTIEFMGGRPERDNIINGDDILNLNIAFNTTKTIEEFIDFL